MPTLKTNYCVDLLDKIIVKKMTSSESAVCVWRRTCVYLLVLQAVALCAAAMSCVAAAAAVRALCCRRASCEPARSWPCA